MTGNVFAVFLSLALVIVSASAQQQPPSNSFIDKSATSIKAQSDAAAIAKVQRAIAAMGGEAAWSVVGAATAKMQSSNKDLPTQHVNWSDDWSSGYNRYRRDSTDQSSSVQATVATQTTGMLRLPNGTLKQIPIGNDIAVLAVGYPAVALALSLHRADCSITSRQYLPLTGGVITSDRVVILERCTGMPYPGYPTELTWTFSTTTGLPLHVLIPFQAVPGGRQLMKRVEYTTFQSNHGLLSPSALSITKPNGRVDDVLLTSTTLLPSLPNQTFDLTKEER
jgi:hypothetical protein